MKISPLDPRPPALKLWHATQPLPTILGVFEELRYRQTRNGWQAYIVRTSRTGRVASMRVLRYKKHHPNLLWYQKGKPVRSWEGVGDLIERIENGTKLGKLDLWHPLPEPLLDPSVEARAAAFKRRWK